MKTREKPDSNCKSMVVLHTSEASNEHPSCQKDEACLPPYSHAKPYSAPQHAKSASVRQALRSTALQSTLRKVDPNKYSVTCDNLVAPAFLTSTAAI